MRNISKAHIIITYTLTILIMNVKKGIIFTILKKAEGIIS